MKNDNPNIVVVVVVVKDFNSIGGYRVNINIE